MDDDMAEKNKDFYSYIIAEGPQPRLRSKYRKFPKGAIYDHASKKYLAPPKIGGVFDKGTRHRNFLINYNSDWHSYIDTMYDSDTSRLNVTIHGMLSIGDEKIIGRVKSISRVYSEMYESGYDADDFAAFTKLLELNESVDHVRMITCYSGNGGENSFAAHVSEKLNKPVTGFRGEVTAITARSFQKSMTKAEMLNMNELSPQLGPFNYLEYNEKGRWWGSTALAKTFYPSFGSRGFDNMAEFFEGAFVR